MAGAVALLAPGEADSAAVTALSEALYVYGYPAASGAYSVLILSTAAHPKPDPELRFAGISTETLPAAARGSLTEMSGPAWQADAESLSRLDLLGAWRGEELVAAVGSESAGLTERIALLYAADKNAALLLLEQCAGRAAEAGRLVVCAWADKRGMLRYPLAEAGFAEQLHALHFTAE
jgi:hypothetical protein